MKYLIAAIIWLGMAATALSAQTYYVTTNSIPIDLRTGPSNQNRVIADLEEAMPVEVLEGGNNGWSRVQTSNGKEGWILTRFLSQQMPSKALLEKLQQEYDDLIAKAGSPLKEIERLKNENQELQGTLTSTQKNLEDMRKSYESLRTESADFLKVKNSYDDAATKLAEQTEKAQKLEMELSKIGFNQNLYWFLGGAGVLLFGFILGVITRRQKRRGSLLQ
jgi:SH3 domain protein